MEGWGIATSSILGQLGGNQLNATSRLIRDPQGITNVVVTIDAGRCHLQVRE